MKGKNLLGIVVAMSIGVGVFLIPNSQDNINSQNVIERTDKENESEIIPDESEQIMDEPPRVSYKIKNGKINFDNDASLETPTEKDKKNHELLWKRVKKIIPKSYMSRIKNFQFNSDGIDGVLAFVDAADDNYKTWNLTLDINDCIDENGDFIENELNRTIIHEFAHILTLNNTQLIDENYKGKDTYIAEEGVTRKDSYLNRFFNKYWKSVFQEWKEYKEVAEEDDTAFYDKYISDFVTNYAATGPEEDIAETFAEFVLSDKKNGTSISDEKVNFFYNFNETVNIRNEIRKNLEIQD